MALIKCPECGREVSDRAKACIHCGCPLEEIKTLGRYAIIINSYADTDTAAMAGLNTVFPWNMSYEEIVEIFSNTPYKIAEYDFEEDAVADAQRLQKWWINVSVVAPDGSFVYVEEGNKIKCPTCGSSKITNVTTGEKIVNIALFGLFGNRRKKKFHCKSCGYEW